MSGTLTHNQGGLRRYSKLFAIYTAVFVLIQLLIIGLKLPVEREGWLSDIAYHWNSQLSGNMAKDIPWGSTWATGRGKSFYFTHSLFYKFFGVGLFQGRMVTLITGIILLWLVFRWTAKYVNSEVAVISTMLLMVSFTFWPFIPVVSQDMSHCLLYFLSFFLLYRGIISQQAIFYFAAGLISGLSVDNSYRGIEIVMCVYIAHFIFRKKGKFLKQSLLLVVGSSAALIIWYWLNIQPMGMENFLKYHISQAKTEENPHIIKMLLNEMGRLALHIRSQRDLAKIEIAYWAVLIVLFFKYRLRHTYPFASKFILVWLLITFVVMSAMSLLDEQISPVYMLHYGIFISILCGMGLYELLQRKKKMAVTILLLILLGGLGYQFGRVAIYSYYYRKTGYGLMGYFERLREKIDMSKNILGDVEYWYAFPDAQYYGGGFYLTRVMAVLKELKPANEYKDEQARAKAILEVLRKRDITYIVSSTNPLYTKGQIAQYFPGQKLPAHNFQLIDRIENSFNWNANPQSDPHRSIEIFEIVSYNVNNNQDYKATNAQKK